MIEQNKELEKDFFNRYGQKSGYDRFSDSGYHKLMQWFGSVVSPRPGESILDLGCGSGAFTARLKEAYPQQNIMGIDISTACIEKAAKDYPGISFQVGDVENTGLQTNSMDIVCYSGVLHHFPNTEKVATEAFRILKPGGRFFSFDPHHHNPAFWLYRSKRSPFYSPVGVTPNERLMTAREVNQVFSRAGLRVKTRIISGIAFCYVESNKGKSLLSLYNCLDGILGATPLARFIGAWVIGWGDKPVTAAA